MGIVCMTKSDDKKPARNKDRVKSLEKGLHLLMILSQSKSNLSLDEVTKRSGYTKTACFRLLKTMQDLNFVEQHPQNSTYRLGPRNISVGAAALKNLSLRDLALPVMQRLQTSTGETINLSVLDQAEVVFIERLEATHIISTHHHIGDRLPVHCTSMGKALLAFLPQHQLDQVLQRIRFESKTEKTVISIDGLAKELVQVRKTGLARNNEELEQSLCAVAAPVLDHMAQPVAALNIAFPLIRHQFKEAVDQYGPQVKQAAKDISKLLGYFDQED